MSESDFSCDSSQSTIQVQTQTQTQIQNHKKETILYDNILKDIRDMNVLSSYKMYYLRGVSRKKLMQIIELYNMVIRNVNEII